MKDFLTPHKPMIKIHLYDWSEIVTDKKHLPVIKSAWDKKQVIEIWDIIVAWANISKIEPVAYDDYSQIDFKVPDKYKKAIEARAKLYTDRLARAPREETIKMWCQRLDRNEPLDPKQ